MYRNRDELPPLGQQRRLGLDIDMIGARGDNLGSTRSETREMRSSNNQEMKRADMTMDNWTQEPCKMSAVTSGPEAPNTFNDAWNHHSPNERTKWRDTVTKELYCMKENGVRKETRITDVQKDRGLKDANGYSKSTEMVYTEQDLLHWDTVKYKE